MHQVVVGETNQHGEFINLPDHPQCGSYYLSRISPRSPVFHWQAFDLLELAQIGGNKDQLVASAVPAIKASYAPMGPPAPLEFGPSPGCGLRCSAVVWQNSNRAEKIVHHRF
jgi:hypothetical protein